MRILVVGAGGYLGNPICAALRNAGHEVIAGLRDPASISRLRQCSGVLRIDLAVPDGLPIMDDLKPFDVVVNAAGIFQESKRGSFKSIHSEGAIRLFRLCEAAGVRRIVQISALDADASATTAYHRSKLAADLALQQLALEWVILRPSLVIGGEGASWRMFKALALLPFTPVGKGNATVLLQPVALDDVVRAVVAAAEADAAAGHAIDIVTPEPLALDVYLDRLASAMGQRPSRRIALPWGLLRLMSRFAFLKPGMPFSSDALVMLQQATARHDADPIRQHFGFLPQSLDEFLSHKPLSRAERLAARLYPVGPALRTVLAFMWLWSGMVSLGLYPVADSLALLRTTGIDGALALPVLFAAAGVDILLGLWTLFTRRPAFTAGVQIALVCAYSLILSFSIPELWLHPFGPVMKNIPIIAAIAIWPILEEDA